MFPNLGYVSNSWGRFFTLEMFMDVVEIIVAFSGKCLRQIVNMAFLKD